MGDAARQIPLGEAAGDSAWLSGDRPQLALVRKVEVDRSRDALLTDFGRTTLEDRYLAMVDGGAR